MLLTPDVLDQIEREYCSRSLANFVRRAWPILDPGMPLVWGPHMDAVCLHLEAVTNGQINRLLINIPPGTSKSSLVSVYWPAWEWGPKGIPTNRVIGASHEQSLSVRDSTKMRRLVTDSWYQKLWPTNLMRDNNQKLSFENESTGFRQACAVRSMTGRRGDRVIWDDPHSAEDAHSPAALIEAKRIFKETLPTRLVSPEHSAIVIVMQRLNENDVSGIILSDDYGYEHLCLPMEYERDRHCKTSIGWEDWRKEEGELLFPGRFPAHVVERDKKLMGSHAVAGQFQQRPSPLGGGILKGEWFGRYTVLPKLKYRAVFVDTAQKAKQHNDYQVAECWGLGEDGYLYLIDVLRDRFQAYELETRIPDFWSKHRAETNGRLRFMAVEDKSSGTELIQKIQKCIKPKIPVRPIPRGPNLNKLTRVMDVQGYIESGYIKIPMDAPWVHDFVTECESFTADDTHAHDDQIDPMCDAISQMLHNGKPSLADIL